MPRPMSKREIEEFYRRLKETRPIPQTELEFINPFTLLVAVVLSAQATDVGVNKATPALDRKSTRLNSSHGYISYAVFCLKKKKKIYNKLHDYTISLL